MTGNPSRANALRAQDWVTKFLEKSPNASVDYIIKQAHHAGYGLRPHEVVPIRRQFQMNQATLRCLVCNGRGHVSKDCSQVVKTADVVIPPRIVPPIVPASVRMVEPEPETEVELPPQPQLPPLQLDGEVDEDEMDEEDDDDQEEETPTPIERESREPGYLSPTQIAALATPMRSGTKRRQAYMEELLLADPKLLPAEVDDRLRERYGYSVGATRIIAQCLLVRELHNLGPLPDGVAVAFRDKRRRDIRARRMRERHAALSRPLFDDVPEAALTREVPTVIPRLEPIDRMSAPSLSSSLAKPQAQAANAGPTMQDGFRAISAQIAALANAHGLSVLKFELGPDKKVKVSYETRMVAEETF